MLPHNTFLLAGGLITLGKITSLLIRGPGASWKPGSRGIIDLARGVSRVGGAP